jgi:hypothetical protein
MTLPDLRHEPEAVLLDDVVALRVGCLIQRQLVAVARSTTPDVDANVPMEQIVRDVREQRLACVGGHLDGRAAVRVGDAHHALEPGAERRIRAAPASRVRTAFTFR